MAASADMVAPDPATTLSTARRCRLLADGVFDSLRLEAITADGLAAWVSPRTEQVKNPGSVGPTVYAGTAGLALALTAHGQATHRDWAVDLAVAATRHAVEHAPAIPAAQREGFYAGWAGIAYAAAAVGAAADDARLRASAVSLVDGLADAEPSGEFDVIGGAAGTVAAMALAAPCIGDRAVDVAIRAATRLAASGRSTRRGGVAWRAPHEARQLPLTGFAHGTSGVAWALHELAGIGGVAGWVSELADQAIRYESSLLAVTEGGWPDLRHYGTWRAVKDLPAPIQVAWCHGAGGIALCRLRSLHLGHASPDLLGDAERAVGWVTDDVDRTITDGRAAMARTWGLCHGLGGHRTTLAHAVDVLGPRHAVKLRRLDDALATLTPGAEALRRAVPEPGVMTGRAGLGLCLLAAAGLSVATPLLPPSLK